MNKQKQNSCCKKKAKEARIQIRVTTKEKELLQSKAQACEMSLGKFLIAAGLNDESIKVIPELNKSLYVELCRQGNNLNQLARLQNTLAASGQDPELYSDDRAILENLCSLINQVLTELKKVNSD
ncbi:MAG: hypothetical protein QNJ55_29125 [Xenococcus sp. MO_188.B8]|nr:hypothetical protein [Xenococcus sp. MO_188.B8]